jgi:DNA-binding HxlR family transcriptional regulator
MADGINANDNSGSNGCPLDPALTLLAQKWLVHIVWLLGRAESLRFTELQRQLPGDVSAKVLSARLKQLEAINMIARDDKGKSRRMSNIGSPLMAARSTAFWSVSR